MHGCLSMEKKTLTLLFFRVFWNRMEIKAINEFIHSCFPHWYFEHTYMCVHPYIYIDVDVHTYVQNISVCMHVISCMYACIYIWVCVCMYRVFFSPSVLSILVDPPLARPLIQLYTIYAFSPVLLWKWCINLTR